MKKLHLLTVIFNPRIASYEIEAFRGAVIEKTGRKNGLYHNHNNHYNAKKAYHYRYPLIQYKLLHRRPAIVFIDQGIDASTDLFADATTCITIRSAQKQLKPHWMSYRVFPFGVVPGQWHYYALTSWMALNSDNYRKFLILNTFEEQKKFLSKILSNHIIAFAKHLNYRFKYHFDVEILEITKEAYTEYEGLKLLTFDLHFRTQVLLPSSIGLGKAVSVGFGTIRPWEPGNHDFLNSSISIT